ncbi:MAG TPA: hypothetical protein PLS51_13205 [Flavobacterium sp.]|jgi:hypothetical protein|nr:hypothetical protein [Flavobacterium sp.]HPJ11585.1 hypothetical protein [Flavobacterium sp.]
MKKTLFLLVLLISATAFCQVPQGISYQAIAANGSGNPIVNSNVGVRLSILDNSASGSTLYIETQTKTTNAQGLFNLVIGQGTVTAGTFAGINWGTNLKFLKVEMDTAGGTNYALVGTTQLLSVPYALAADSLVTSAGEGITLVSPNGTPYTITVNDAGQLSLPTSGTTGTTPPATLYLYGSFNGYNPTTALLMGSANNFYFFKLGFKYFTAGTELKLISQNNAGGAVYGLDANDQVVLNGAPYVIPANGFYKITPFRSNGDFPYLWNALSIAPQIYTGTSYYNPTYNVGTNTFSFTVNSVTATTNNNQFYIKYDSPAETSSNGFGDNLADGTLENGGTIITFPNLNATPKNFRVDLIINFNGSATYTITQI